MRERLDPVSLVAGLATAGAGVLLWLDQAGEVALSPGSIGAMMAALLGVILLVSGLREGGD